MVVIEGKGERGHGMLPFFASAHEGKWTEKNILRHQRGDKEHIQGKILRSHSPSPPQPVNCERSLSSLLDDIMNKEIFIRTVNLIVFFFFQHGKPTKKKEKKTGKGIEIDLSEILIYYSTTAVVSSYTI